MGRGWNFQNELDTSVGAHSEKSWSKTRKSIAKKFSKMFKR